MDAIQTFAKEDLTLTNIPFLYDYTNSNYGSSNVVVTNSHLSRYFQRQLLQKAISVFKWKMPDNWAENYTLFSLYCFGFVSVVKTDKYGVIPQHCGLSGYDVFYRPNTVIFSNPLIQSRPLTIGKDCELLRLQPDYSGILDTVRVYADLMALCVQAASVNLLNSKLSYVFFADNSALAQSFKKLIDEIESGKPAVIADGKLKSNGGGINMELLQQNVKANFITPELLVCLRNISNMFATEIGLPNANTDKRERLISDEVNANNVETSSKVSAWLENLQKDCERVVTMFPEVGELTVDWRYTPNIGGCKDV